MRILFVLLVISFLISCSTVRTTNYGMLYTDAKTTEMVVDGGAALKVGEACTEGILGVVTGDSSLEKAKKNGKITKVSYVDNYSRSVLGIYTKYCTVVKGK